jgi:phage-related protein
MSDEPSLKRVVWVGSSRRDLRALPDAVQDRVGYALYIAQRGGKHQDAKPLKGFGGAGVVEVVTDYRAEIHSGLCTRFGSQTVCMCFTCFKRSRRGGAKRPSRTRD